MCTAEYWLNTEYRLNTDWVLSTEWILTFAVSRQSASFHRWWPSNKNRTSHSWQVTRRWHVPQVTLHIFFSPGSLERHSHLNPHLTHDSTPLRHTFTHPHQYAKGGFLQKSQRHRQRHAARLTAAHPQALSHLHPWDRQPLSSSRVWERRWAHRMGDFPKSPHWEN